MTNLALKLFTANAFKETNQFYKKRQVDESSNLGGLVDKRGLADAKFTLFG